MSSVNPLTIGEMTFTEDKDYQVRHMPYGSASWNLLIKNVQLRHAGGYECQISTKDKMKKTVYLTVIGNCTNILTLCILIDRPIHIKAIRMELFII